MEEITIFNLQAVNRGMLKATVSVQLESGLIIHDCKILEQDGTLVAQLPQRSERLKGGQVIYHDLLEFADPQAWASLAPQLVAYYQAHAADLP
jgi:DNA-binding cell septation regulator SpoVG